MSSMIDWRILDRHSGSDTAMSRREPGPRSRRLAGVSRPHVSLAMLSIAAAITLLPGRLWSQGAEQGGGRGKVVVEQSTGAIELASPAPAAPSARAGAASPAAAVRLVSIGGSVRDTLGGATLAGARIELLGTRYSTRSSEDGHFRLGAVPAGRYTVRVTRIGYEPITIGDVALDATTEAPLSLSMRRRTVALSEMVITPGHFGLLQGEAGGSQALSRETLETIPQIGEDIYRAVSRLPGVTADDFSAKFGVRGGTGDEMYVSLDGLELVEPFHLKDVGGAFSIIDIQTLGTASLNTGGFSAEYGDRLAGVFTLTTSDPRTDGVHGSVGVSAMNARATLQGGFAGGKGGWVLSARPGYLDVALKFTEIADSIQPRYYDLFAKARIRPARRRPHRPARTSRRRHVPIPEEGRAEHLQRLREHLCVGDVERSVPRRPAPHADRAVAKRHLVAAPRRELFGCRRAERAHRRHALARQSGHPSGLDVRRVPVADVQVGRRRQARVGELRLSQSARCPTAQRDAHRPQRQHLQRPRSASGQAGAVRRTARPASALAHRRGGRAIRSLVAHRRVDREPAAERVVAAARAHGGSRRVGRIQSVTVALLAPGRGRCEQLRPRGARRAAHLGVEQSLRMASLPASRLTSGGSPTRDRSTRISVGTCGCSRSCSGTAS
jgi:hypothetical protein